MKHEKIRNLALSMAKKLLATISRTWLSSGTGLRPYRALWNAPSRVSVEDLAAFWRTSPKRNPGWICVPGPVAARAC